MNESNGKHHGISDSNQTVETKECGCFDFLPKKDVKTKHDVVMEDPRKENKPDLRRLHSQSSTSSDEESEGERKKNKMTLKEDVDDVEVVDVDEKKGFLENMKEHLPGKHKEPEEGVPTSQTSETENDTKEKKGILEKIKEKFHRNVDGELEDKKKEN